MVVAGKKVKEHSPVVADLDNQIQEGISALQDKIQEIQEVRRLSQEITCSNGVCSLGAWRPSKS